MDFRIYVVALLGVAILVEALVLGFHIVKFNETGAKKFNFFTYIPYELSFRLPPLREATKVNNFLFYFNIFKSWFLKIIPNLIMIVAMLMFALHVQFNGGDITAAYIIFSVFTLANVFYMILTNLKLSYYSEHMLVTTLFVISTVLLLTLYIFFFTNDHYNFGNGVPKKGMEITNFIIIIILIVFELVLMLNKNYKNWFKMVKVDAETYNRPKYCYLAMLEWGTLLNLFLAFVPVIIVLYF